MKKHLNRILHVLSVAPLALIALAACAVLSTNVRSDAFPGDELVGVHDTYVVAEDAGEPAFLAESAALLAALDAAPEMSQAALRALAGPVVERYDAYLDAGEAAGEFEGAEGRLELRVYRRTSDLARELAGMPGR